MVKKISTKIPKSITVVRIAVGLLFIFSGLVKANDPLGLSYKMQEFFEAWGWQGLDVLALPMAYLMNIFEVLAGVALIVGYAMPLFSWLLLLLMLFFAFLTGYATLSGKFRSCGCFGDCLPIPPMASFLKDLVLLILIVVLFVYRHKIKPLFPWDAVSIFLLVAAIGGVVYLQQYVLQHLPVRDCLPYAEGKNLLLEMELPKGAVPDSTVITFKYKHKGKTVEFDGDHFPTDFNDTTYEYADRYDKVVRKGNAVPLISDFALLDENDVDTTKGILSQPGKYILVLTQNFDHWQTQQQAFNSVFQSAKAKGIPVFIVSPNIKQAKNIFPSDVYRLKLDATVLKTAARVNATYILMQGATVATKRSYVDAKDFIASYQR